ncbi:MAG: hypothetical protein LBD90_07330, partial [Bifidobacteriaceae bacterium]|nr:hypothetical protein [Bifidobacteriaceae bacterium]
AGGRLRRPGASSGPGWGGAVGEDRWIEAKLGRVSLDHAASPYGPPGQAGAPAAPAAPTPPFSPYGPAAGGLPAGARRPAASSSRNWVARLGLAAALVGVFAPMAGVFAPVAGVFWGLDGLIPGSVGMVLGLAGLAHHRRGRATNRTTGAVALGLGLAVTLFWFLVVGMIY